jgi:S-adenosylmethionine/arginine decarboxylase-like enzyme
MENDEQRTAPQHNHLLINAKSYANCMTKSTLTNKRKMKEWLTKLVQEIGMNKVAGPFVRYIDKPGNKGLTAVVMIETSHIALHVWDEPVPAHIQFDIYTCSGLDVYSTLAKIVEELSIDEISWIFFDREFGFKNVLSGDSVDDILRVGKRPFPPII